MVASFADSLGRAATTEPLRQPEIATLAHQLATVAALIFGEHMLLSPAEADAIAHPAARLLARHTPMQKIIRHYTDPLVLLGVVGAIARARIARPKTQNLGVARPVVAVPQPTQQTPPRPDPVEPPIRPSTVADAAAAAVTIADAMDAMARIP